MPLISDPQLVYDLVVALPPSKTNKKLPDGQLEAFIDAIARGEHPATIAKRLHPKDRVARQRVRRQLERVLHTDHRVGQGVAERARTELLVGLAPTVKAMAKRGARGRVDAGKVILEASGFHNPRVKHEHSGDIKVTLDMPRPKFEQDQGAIDVPDADVVDD